MLKKRHRIWLLLFAGVLMLFLFDRMIFSVAQSYEISKNTKNTQSEVEKYTVFKGPIFRVVGSIATTLGATEISGFIHKYENAITAVSTVIIAIYTIVLAGATRALTKLGQLQKGDMRKSLNIAKESADTAKRSADIAELAMVAGERAFIFATSLTPFWEKNVETGAYHWRFRPQWTNTGDTPTRDMVMHSECVLRDTLLPEGFNFDYDTTETGRAVIPPKTPALGGLAPRIPAPAISPQDIVDIQQGRKFLYFLGWARYYDVFPNAKRHITRFCWFITPVGDPNAYIPVSPGRPEILTFSYMHHIEGNCIDDECDQEDA